MQKAKGQVWGGQVLFFACKQDAGQVSGGASLVKWPADRPRRSVYLYLYVYIYMFVCIYMCKCRHTYSYIFPNMYPKGLENPPKKERGFCMGGYKLFRVVQEPKLDQEGCPWKEIAHWYVHINIC